MIKLLIDESPLMVLPSLAERIGLDEAITLQQVHYLVGMSAKVENTQVYKDGYYWVFNTTEQWQSKYFRWWSVPTVKRIFQGLTESRLLTASPYGGGRSHKRLWYRVNHDLVDFLAKRPTSDFPLSRNDRIKMIRSFCSDQNEPLVLDQNDLIKSDLWDQNDLPSIYKRSNIKRDSLEGDQLPSPPQTQNANAGELPKDNPSTLDQKTESFGKPDRSFMETKVPQPALINVYAQAKDVYELIDAFLLSPEMADAHPPRELIAVLNEKKQWKGWVLPWRSPKMDREFQNCNPEIVKKIASQLAQKEKATPQQKYGHAVAIINTWEKTKGGWSNLMTLCDRPQDAETAIVVGSMIVPEYIKNWYESQHQLKHRDFKKSNSLQEWFEGKDNQAWYEYAKQQFPDWDWDKN